MSNCQLLARITTDRVSAAALTYRLLLVAVALLPLDVLLAYPALAQQPLYVGDFDEPSERKEYRPFELNRGAFSRPLGCGPAGRPSKIIPAREKGFVDFLKVEKNSKGQLFIKSDDKKVFLLKLSEAQVRFFFGKICRKRAFNCSELIECLQLLCWANGGQRDVRRSQKRSAQLV